MVPEITNVTFQILEAPSPLGDAVRIVIESVAPLTRAIATRVRVGTQEGRIGPFRLSDGALNVYLQQVPTVGDVVFVGWADGNDLEATSFTYQPAANV
ncbi:MAG TPA: hypothetical protein VIX73_04880 [Kofleriaceae bacterium]|jgi:hypothetical protein